MRERKGYEMKDKAIKHWRLCTGLLITAVLAGCATSRGVVAPQMSAGANPQHGVAVRIVSVEDKRSFQVEPKDPSIPSLMDNNVGDSDLKSRAVARKRNGFGKALGDVILPEGQSVSGLTEKTIARTLRDAGYRVVTSTDSDYEQAIPVTAQVDKLWAWFRPGFWAIAIESNYDITVAGNVPGLQAAPKVSGETRTTMQMATGSDWTRVVEDSLSSFAAKLKEKLTAR